MSLDGRPEALVCATYTHARRHPMVLGRIAGWSPPFQLTITQLVVVMTCFLVMVWTWRLWAPLLPDTAATLAVVGVPTVAAWAVRRVRVEGRSLARAGLGRLALWCAPTRGRVAGRPHRDPRPASLASRRVFVAPEQWRPRG
jgi:hypothetical protein